MSKRGRWDSSSEDEKEQHTAAVVKKRSTNKPTFQDKQDIINNKNEPDLPLHNPLLQGCRSVYTSYEQIARISEGTFGIVWKARDLSKRHSSHTTNNNNNDDDDEDDEDSNQSIVALKQIKFYKEQLEQGFPTAALREITCLLDLSHENIVSVQEMVVGDKFEQVFMVMQYFEFDLKQGLDRFEGALFQSELKSILHQILVAAEHIHTHWYMHRDIKTSNILVHRTGRIALADFGLARRYETPQTRSLTVLVCTLWYRAPELLFGEDKYSPKIDLWSIGCVFAELIAKAPLFEGQGELDQIDQIFELVGTPTMENWPGFEQLPNAKLLRWKNRNVADTLLTKKFPVASPVSSNQCFLDSQGFDLLAGLLRLDPVKRMSAQDALAHAYFQQGVMPKTPRFFSAA
jgi:cell division cycle 2-like protein